MRNRTFGEVLIMGYYQKGREPSSSLRRLKYIEDVFGIKWLLNSQFGSSPSRNRWIVFN